MIVRYWGMPLTLLQCRERIGGGRDGVNGLMIANAARSLGLNVAAYRLAPGALAPIALPAIAHWQGNHFVVIETWNTQHVVILDPAVGRCRLTPTEWQAGYSGVVLTCSPTAAFSFTIPTPSLRERVMHSPWLVFFRHLWHIPMIPVLLAHIIVATLLLQALGLALPLFTRHIVDHILPTGHLDSLHLLGLGMVLFVLAQATMGYLRQVVAIRLQTRIDAHLLIGFFAHLTTLPHRFFQEHTSGDLLMRLESTTLLHETLTGKLIASMIDGVLVKGYLVILLVLAPVFGALVLAVVFIQIALLVATSRPMHHLSQCSLTARAMRKAISLRYCMV